MNESNYISDLENTSSYSSKKTVARYKGLLIIISVIAVGLTTAFGIRAYQISKIDPFEKPGSTLAQEYFLSSAKDFFDQEVTRLPVSAGSCSVVDLREVQEANLMSDIPYYERCNKSSTYVKACKLESGSYHFEINMSCGNEQIAYGEEKELLDEKDLSKNMNSRVNFSFKGEKLNTQNVVFGDPVRVWKDEINFSHYKILQEITYYRTRDKEWRFKGDIRYFYPEDKSISLDVEEYYIMPPSEEYMFKETSQNYAYKWYLQLGDMETRYYYPSGSTDITKENTYYVTAPVKGAKKEESTKTFAAKYYRIQKTDYSDYFPIEPSNNAIKLNDSLRWSAWTEYKLSLPRLEPYGKGNREVETRIQVQVIPIKTTGDLVWNEITEDYVTERELINRLQKLGYQVQNLNDITLLKDIKYEIKQTYQKPI